MNWKSGFRIAASVSTILVAFISAGLTLILVTVVHDNALSHLQWHEEAYKQELEEQQKQEVEKALRKHENDFWVNLSKADLVWMGSLGGLVGGLIGFLVIWLPYRLLAWILVGSFGDTGSKSE